jgi:hypothetical protein
MIAVFFGHPICIYEGPKPQTVSVTSCSAKNRKIQGKRDNATKVYAVERESQSHACGSLGACTISGVFTLRNASKPKLAASNRVYPYPYVITETPTLDGDATPQPCPSVGGYAGLFTLPTSHVGQQRGPQGPNPASKPEIASQMQRVSEQARLGQCRGMCGLY